MTLLGYTARRIVLTIPVFVGVVTIIFLVVRVLPGDPAQVALGDYASQAAVENLRARLGLDAPLPVQYLTFLAGLARGDLGHSLINGASVRDQIAYNLPFTVELSIAALALGVASGIPLGILAATRRNGSPDVVVRVLSLAVLSLPAFYVGILLVVVFGVWLRWLPAIGGGNLGSPADQLLYLALPALTLGLLMMASVLRVTRSAVLNTLDADYVRTGRAKGIRERGVIFVHALRPALLPIVSLTGVWAVALVGDSVTTEVVFARPGLGKLLVGAMLQRDYTSVQSVMVVYTAFVVAINLLTDVVYGVVDPRIRSGYA
jgi:ABC-type dipeptide/oligopeptide/nickel transport system permease component